MNKKIKIVLVDDHQIVIDGLKALLSDHEEIEIVGEANNGQEVIRNCLDLNPDLLLIDIGMPVMDGITTCAYIKKNHPEIKTLILTTFADRKNIRDMLKLDIDGYILKDSGKTVFIDAIRAVCNNEKYYDQRVVNNLMQGYSGKKDDEKQHTPLTKREKEIVRLIAQGMSTSEIAEELFLSQLTIETHRKNIYIKLGMNKIASLVRYAYENGLVD